MTRILKCKCSNEYQDKKYGNQQRVFNKTKKMFGNQYYYRCTVCQAVKATGG